MKRSIFTYLAVILGIWGYWYHQFFQVEGRIDFTMTIFFACITIYLVYLYFKRSKMDDKELLEEVEKNDKSANKLLIPTLILLIIFGGLVLYAFIAG